MSSHKRPSRERCALFSNYLSGCCSSRSSSVHLSRSHVPASLRWDAFWVPRWIMFSGKGLGILRVRTVAVDRKTGEERLVSWDTYDSPPRPHRPRRVKVVTRERDVWSFGRRVCRNEGPNVEVYVPADRAVKSGWKRELDGVGDICRRRKKSRRIPKR